MSQLVTDPNAPAQTGHEAAHGEPALAEATHAAEASAHVRPADRCAMVVFGASGDLTRRKLLPALYNLAKKKQLSPDFALVGCAIEAIDEQAFRERVRAGLREFGGAPEHCDFCDWLVERLHYVSGDFRDPETYKRLGAKLRSEERRVGKEC
jgi:glucose-6-phosphate 1-dehydrogenase